VSRTHAVVVAGQSVAVRQATHVPFTSQTTPPWSLQVVAGLALAVSQQPALQVLLMQSVPVMGQSLDVVHAIPPSQVFGVPPVPLLEALLEVAEMLDDAPDVEEVVVVDELLAVVAVALLLEEPRLDVPPVPAGWAPLPHPVPVATSKPTRIMNMKAYGAVLLMAPDQYRGERARGSSGYARAAERSVAHIAPTPAPYAAAPWITIAPPSGPRVRRR
jgi:hypothetical protein